MKRLRISVNEVHDRLKQENGIFDEALVYDLGEN